MVPDSLMSRQQTSFNRCFGNDSKAWFIIDNLWSVVGGWV